MTYERTCQVERADELEPGVIGGTLATDGESEDGHILNIPGGSLTPGAPLLFEHGRIKDFGPLGSWLSFETVEGRVMGESHIDGLAKIEMEGDGPWQAQRRDMFHMVEQKHIRGFSIRWDVDGEKPMLRSSLPSSHIAHVPRSATGARARGIYFPKWKMVEGSVAVIGKDQGAVIDRIQRCDDPDLATFWRSVMDFEAESVELAEQANTEDDYQRVLRESNAILVRANERLSIALDLYERDTDLEMVRSEGEREMREDPAEIATPEAPEQATPAATLPAMTPGDVLRSLREGFSEARDDLRHDRRAAISRKRGEVSK